jgi:hypothetical protein
MQYHWRMSMTFLKAFIFGTPEVFVGNAASKFDKTSLELTDQGMSALNSHKMYRLLKRKPKSAASEDNELHGLRGWPSALNTWASACGTIFASWSAAPMLRRKPQDRTSHAPKRLCQSAMAQRKPPGVPKRHCRTHDPDGQAY